CLLAVVSVVAGGIWLLHRVQAGPQAQAFLSQAELAENEGNLEKAASYLRRYLILNRGDIDVRGRLGLLLDETARSDEERTRAFLVLEDVLRDEPERDAIRRQTIDIAMRLGMYDRGNEHIEYLLRGQQNDAELLDLNGQCLLALGKHEKAAEAFQKAITQ